MLIRFMKKLFAVMLVSVVLFSCNNKRNIPDVSAIKAPLDVMRFDRDFFSIDTNDVSQALDQLQRKYPSFLNDYLYNILMLPPMEDSVVRKVKLFIHDYKPVYDSVQQKFPSIDKQKNEIQRGLQFVKYYFPQYKIPEHVITFVGPIEGYGNVLTQSGFAVGLQLYLGKNFSVYQSDYISEVYPAYQSRRFEAAYIPVNCMKNVINDIYPPGNKKQPLVEQMIEEGKRLFVLDYFLPETADTLKTGYTKEQLEGCYDHEAVIWNFFIQNNLLYITDPLQTRDYVNDGPKTEALGEASPGNIGQFVGWQIVKKWMSLKDEKTEKDEKMSLQQLLATPAKQIFEEAKYKPR